MEMNKKSCKSMKIFEIHEHVWDISVSDKKRWDIFYIPRVWRPHISVLQREINRLNQENGNWCFGENMDSDLQITCQSHFFLKIWNDPTVITDILPQPVSRKTPIEVGFLTKVLKVIFPNVWGSNLRQYSLVWQSFCGNFDEILIRTRLA